MGRPAAGQYFSAWATDVNLAWELDFWGRFRRAIEAADADLHASVENYDDVLVMLLGDVGITYVEIRTLQSRLEAARANVEAQQGALRIAEVRFNEGRSTKLDVFQAQNNLAQTESAIPALELALRRASNRLCILCGTAPRDLEQELGIGPIPVPPIDVAVGVPADLLHRRPDVRRAERELAAQSARIGVAMALSILFGTTSMLAVTVTFEKKGGAFDRLLLAPIPLELLMLAKTSGAAFFGTLNAFVPVVMAAFVVDLGGVIWWQVVVAVVLIAVSSTFLGLFIAVAVSEVFEAQTFSNFFRFPMVFLCGLFFPVEMLPLPLRPLSYAIPLTYGADMLHGSVNHAGRMPVVLSLAVLIGFCAALFLISLRNIRQKWIT